MMDDRPVFKLIGCQYHVGPPWPDPAGGCCGEPVAWIIEWKDGPREYVCREHAEVIEMADLKAE